MASSTTISQLTPLLSTTPYLLAYALPLLLLSLILTFSGTFLTLDRSRSFPPTDGAVKGGKGYAALPKPGTLSLEKTKKTLRRLHWILEGGIGGLAGGYVFGLHFATALAILIPATTASATLSPKAFLAIWILTCAVTTPLAGRYCYIAFFFFGLSGGTLFALALSIIIHPSLLSRVILVGIFLPLFTLLVLFTAIVPIPRLTAKFLHPVLRFCTASTGSFGIVLSIALLLKPQAESWANAWERFYMENASMDGYMWGSSQEQGLSAAYAVFLFSGIAVDWALRRRIGECPDEKWDKYLAQYAANLPNRPDRAGTFQPLTTIWDRLFPPPSPVVPFEKEAMFGSEVDVKTAVPEPLPVTMHNKSPGRLERGMELTSVPASTELLRKKRSKAHRGGGWRMAGVDGERKERKPVKFGETSDSSDSDSDDETKKASSSSSPASSPVLRSHHPERKWTLMDARHFTSSSSTPTLVGLAGKNTTSSSSSDPRIDSLNKLDYDKEIAQLKMQRKKLGVEDDCDDLDYSDYDDNLAARPILFRTRTVEETEWTPAFLTRHQSARRAEPGHLAAPAPVPATPSLIKAIDRLAMAQREAFGKASNSTPVTPPATSPVAAAPTKAPAPASGKAESNPKPESNAKPPRPPRSASRSRSTSQARRQQHVSPEDAEMGAAVQLDEPSNSERSPRWEEFWREVRVKAQT
ncbi:hypothetical protein JR316_0006813 [Psilocybe cubensis]|uniref:DUF4203 domain-containing protein n=2 Tax=Psilocybe cubensis TaxID=181762 RepID=A0A8H7XLR9_PSICU|nr:hypothetical protein JR316_0006813 [Psilocybe cubensis]KAH9480215.1 hypothetical protein JR316_0006813 [Psilocybe cubensis]